MKTALQILKEGRELISDPGRWTQGAMARNKEGFSTSACSTYAECFCSLGAITKVENKFSSNVPDAIDALRVVMVGSVSDYNDTHTHKEVLEKWDEAIRLCLNVIE